MMMKVLYLALVWVLCAIPYGSAHGLRRRPTRLGRLRWRKKQGPKCPCGTPCYIGGRQRRWRSPPTGTCLEDEETCAVTFAEVICKMEDESFNESETPEEAEEDYGCTCGEPCMQGRIRGICQADGFTCAQNIKTPVCGSPEADENDGEVIPTFPGPSNPNPSQPNCAAVLCPAGPNTRAQAHNGPDGAICYGEIPPGECCPAEVDCSNNHDDTPIHKDCTGGKVWNTCGSACPSTCEEILNPPDEIQCIEMCVSGCFCPDNLVIGNNGDCVQPEECKSEATLREGQPATVTNPTECPGLQEYYECGSACPPKCSDATGEPIQCTEQCVSGCFCPEGYFILDGTEECVKSSECPNCDIVRCAAAPFSAIEVNNGEKKCYGGLVGCCPEEIPCPEPVDPVNDEQCKNGMEFHDCGTSCPPSCEEPLPQNCDLQCVRGCFCPDGLLLSYDHSHCVPPEECSSDDPIEASPEEEDHLVDPFPEEDLCGYPMVFDECGSACPPTCDDPTPTCHAGCVPGCSCPKDTVLDENGRCILPRECPEA